MAKEEKISALPATPDPKPTVGRIVHYYDPRKAADANDGMGRGPYAALVLKITPGNDQVADDRVHLRVSFWGSDGWFAYVLPKDAKIRATDQPYWEWPPRA